MTFKRWLYRGGRPHTLAKILNRGWAMLHATGLLPASFVTLEVVGRKSGKVISFPLAMLIRGGERYLISMLGDDANWVQNVRAADGLARLIRGSSEPVHLSEVPVAERAPLLKAYLRIAPGARPHIPVSKDAPLADFAAVASAYPVFRVETVR